MHIYLILFKKINANNKQVSQMAQPGSEPAAEFDDPGLFPRHRVEGEN